jgi:UDP-glucose 4-epimerase
MGSYLVTGGAGFIGSHIVDFLVDRGDSVRVLDDFSSGKAENIEQNLNKIGLIHGSVADVETVRDAVKGIDYVLHHAAIASVPGSIDDPITANEVNIAGTLNVLISSRDAGVKRVVFASSSAVYGDLPTLPKIETLATDPMSPYALNKLAGEYYCKLCTALYGLETVCLRYFNVFGPRQDPNSQYSAVIPKFLTMMLSGESPRINGDGFQSRDFTFVSNNVMANFLACHTSNVAGEVFNIGCGESFSLLELVDELNEILGTDIKPEFGPARAGDVKNSIAGIDKARAGLKFEPSVGFHEGLKRLVGWYLGK